MLVMHIGMLLFHDIAMFAKLPPKTNAPRHYKSKKGRSFNKFDSALREILINLDVFELIATVRLIGGYFFEKRQVKIATEFGVKLDGDYEQRGSGRAPGGKLACFEVGNTSPLCNECPIYLANVEKFGNPAGKGKKSAECKKKKKKKCYKGKTGAYVRLLSLHVDVVRNTGVSENADDANDGQRNVNLARREVLIPDMILRRNIWRSSDRTQPNRGDCSCVIDTCFNRWSLCSFNRLTKYIDYIRGICHMGKIAKTIGESIRCGCGVKESRDSTHETVIHIWEATEFEPSEVLLITGDSELLL